MMFQSLLLQLPAMKYDILLLLVLNSVTKGGLVYGVEILTD